MNFRNLEFPNSNNSACDGFVECWDSFMLWLDTSTVPLWLVLATYFAAMYFSWLFKRDMDAAREVHRTVHGEDNSGPPSRK